MGASKVLRWRSVDPRVSKTWCPVEGLPRAGGKAFPDMYDGPAPLSVCTRLGNVQIFVSGVCLRLSGSSPAVRNQ